MPLSLLMIIVPMISAGRGMRSLIYTAVLELAVVLAIWLISWSYIAEAFEHFGSDWLLLLPFVGLFVFPLTMGAIIVYAKASEEIPPKNVCRVCGYDLRESPQRCPECGTPVHYDPERF
jgi:hypothetical protein